MIVIVMDATGREVLQRCVEAGQYLIGSDPDCPLCVPLSGVATKRLKIIRLNRHCQRH